MADFHELKAQVQRNREVGMNHPDYDPDARQAFALMRTDLLREGLIDPEDAKI